MMEKELCYIDMNMGHVNSFVVCYLRYEGADVYDVTNLISAKMTYS